MDSLTFELSSLAPLKGKKWKLKSPKKRAISKTPINDVVSVNFQIVNNVLKIVKAKIRKQKLHIRNKNYTSITYQKANVYWHKLTRKLFKK